MNRTQKKQMIEQLKLQQRIWKSKIFCKRVRIYCPLEGYHWEML